MKTTLPGPFTPNHCLVRPESLLRTLSKVQEGDIMRFASGLSVDADNNNGRYRIKFVPGLTMNLIDTPFIK